MGKDSDATTIKADAGLDSIQSSVGKQENWWNKLFINEK
jgi:hypothetical protein